MKLSTLHFTLYTCTLHTAPHYRYLRFWSKTVTMGNENEKKKQKSPARQALEDGCIVMCLDDGLSKHFLHLGYLNYKTWSTSLLVLRAVETVQSSACVQLEVCGAGQIQTSNYNYKIPSRMSWQCIYSTAK